MVLIRTGDRIGKQAKIALGCSAAFFDENRQRILLIRLLDLWALDKVRVTDAFACQETTIIHDEFRLG